MTHRRWMLGLAVCLAAALAGCSDDTTVNDVPVHDDGGADADADGDADGDADADADSGDAADSGDGYCTSNEQCQDDLYCNGLERCEDNVCVTGADPCSDSVECTVNTCDDELDRCFHTGDNSLCQDEFACDGEELCGDRGCEEGVRPDCRDDSPCTIDRCDETATPAGCVHLERDLDGDTYMTRDYGCDALGGTDCNDSDELIGPGAEEVCADIRDNDCDGLADFADPACRPANDSCAGSTLLEEDVSVNASTRGTVHDYTMPCCSWCSYEDVVFSITIAEAADVVVDIATRGGSVYADFESSCGVSTTSMRCLYGSTVQLRRNGLLPGTYYVVVQGTAVDFSIVYHTEGPTPVPTNDTCATAQTLEERVTVNTSTADMLASYTVPCYWTTGEDMVYAITIDHTADIVVDLVGRGTIYADLERTCGVSSSSMRCLGGTTVSLRRNSLPAGTYYVVVLGPGGVDYSITYHLEGPTPIPPNDVCSGAIDLPAAGGLVTGTLLDTTNHYVPSCAAGGAYPDVFYRLTLTEPHKITITGQLSPASFNTYVSLMNSCGDVATEIACGSGSTATISRNFLDAGVYYVAVDGNAESPFSLNVLLEAPIYPPVNDRCPGTDVGAGGTFLGTMADTYRDYPPSCSATTLSDVVYNFTLTEPHDVTVAVTPVGSSTAYVAALRTTCSDLATEIGCRSGNPAQFTRRSLPAGTYYVVVSGPTTSPGNQFVLVVTMGPPTPVPANDSCSGAAEVSGGGRFTGSTVACSDDYAPTCGATMTYPDIVYNLTLAANRDVTLNLSSTAGTNYLDIRNGACGTGTTSTACLTAAAPTTFLRNLPAGSYWLLVDTGMEATTTLDVAVAPPTSACDRARVITVDYTSSSTFIYTDSGTTAGMPNDFQPSCIYGTYPDMPYQLVLPARSNVAVSTTTTTYDGALHMRRACDIPSTEIGCNDDCGSTRASCVPYTGSTLALDAGTYYIIVDGYGGSGDYTITVTTTEL